MYNAFTINLSVSYLVTGIILSSLGIFVIRHKPNTLVKKKFGLYCFSIAGWALASCPGILGPHHVSLFLGKVLLTAVIFIPITFLDFILTYLEVKVRYIRIALYASSVPFLIALWPANWFCRDVVQKYKVPYFSDPGPAYYAFIVFYLVIVISGLILLRSRIKRTTDTEKRLQMQFLLWSTFIAYVGGHSNFNLVFEIEPQWLAPWGTYLVALYGIVVFITILRFRLLDISIALKKGLIYSGFVTTTSLVIFLIFVTAQQLLGAYLPISDRLHIFLLTLFLGVFFLPVYHLIQDTVFRFIFKRPLATVLNDLDKLYLSFSDSERHRMAATLASSLAHEIRNPLTALYTFTDQAEQHRNDPLFWEKFSRITKSEIGRINTLIQELLDFAGPKNLKMEQGDLNQLIRDSLTLTQARIREHGVKVDLNLCENATATFDKQRIQQVLLNLIFNAVEAMPTGGTLTITTDFDQSPALSYDSSLPTPAAA